MLAFLFKIPQRRALRLYKVIPSLIRVTMSCRKYELDGSLKKSFGKGNCKNLTMSKKAAHTYAQLSAKEAKLEKAVKK